MFQLVLLAVRNKALEGNVRALRDLCDLYQRYGPPDSSKGGVLLLPETPEEWVKKAEKHSAWQKRLIAEWEEKEAAETAQRRKS